MRNYTLFLALFLSFNNVNLSQDQPDSKRNFVLKIKDSFKISKIKGYIAEGDYETSIALAQKYLIDNPKSAALHFKLGESFFLNKNNAEALQYFEKVKNLEGETDNEFHYYYAKSLQMTGDFEGAKKELSIFKSKLAKNEKNSLNLANRVDAEIEYATSLMKRPVNVKSSNLGTPINSNFDEYGPSVSSDGKTLLFTSRRPDTKGGRRDPNDSKFLEDIYISTWNDSLGFWSKAIPVPGKLNTEDHDGCLSLSPEGDVIYLYRNEGEAGKGAGDIYYSKRLPSGIFTTAKPLEKPVNTTYFESSATVTSDGSKLFFISETKGGLGRADIYYSEKISRKEWSIPVNLGEKINTKDDERMVFIHPSGNTLYFSSNGHPGIGGYDIYKRELVDGEWSAPLNMGYPINTIDDEVNFSLTADENKAYVSGYFDGGFGLLDIYELDLSNYDISIIKDLQKSNPISKPEVKKSKNKKPADSIESK